MRPQATCVIGLLLLMSWVPAWAQAAPESVDPPVATADASPAPGDAGDPDDLLAQRLRSILRNVNGLERLDVQVDSGVVLLRGPVLGVDQPARAIAIAEKLDGVIAVEADIQIERNLRRRLAPLLDGLRDRLFGWLAAVPTLIIAVLITFVFWWTGRWIAARERLTRRWAPNPFIGDFLKSLLHGAIFIFGVVLALEVVGASAFLGSILGALGLAGLAVGIAIRDTVENFIASLLLSVRQPFAPNDHVLIEGHEGNVARLTSRATILMNIEGNHVRIPNALVYKGTIVNYTRNPNRRFGFEVGIDSAGDPAVAQEVALRALQSISAVLTDPGPSCVTSRLGDSNVVLTVLGWVNQTQADFGKTRGAAINAIKRAFEQSGIGMPEPSYNLNLTRAAAEPPAAAEAPQATPAMQPDLRPDDDLKRQSELYASGVDLLDANAPQE